MGVTRWSQRRVRRYLLHALTIIERRALYTDTVDWPAVRAEAVDDCADAASYADTHDTIHAVLRRAGGPHSGMRRPRPGGAPWREFVPPTGAPVDGAAHLRLPSCGGDYRSYRDAGARAVRDLAATGPAGWIVDLRGNEGGNMWPMLAVVAPLLPDGVLGHFVPPAGPDHVWHLRQGRVKLDRRTLGRAGQRPVPAVPVAVLTDGPTGSAGEAVAVAFRGRPSVRTFGAPTAGMTSANEPHRLRDGAQLYVTVADFADHHRTVYRGPLPPDEDGGDDPLAAAVDWIHRS